MLETCQRINLAKLIVISTTLVSIATVDGEVEEEAAGDTQELVNCLQVLQQGLGLPEPKGGGR